MSKTRKDNKKVRITIRAYERTIDKIKEEGSTLQKEWDEYVEKRHNMSNDNTVECEKE